MTTVTFQTIRGREIQAYDPETDNYDYVETLVSVVDFEATILGNLTSFMYEVNDFDETTLLNADRGDLDAYGFRVNGEALNLQAFVPETYRFNWGNGKETDVLFFFADNDIEDSVDEFGRNYFEYYLITLGGDSFRTDILDDFDAWIDTFPRDEDGDADIISIDSGPFQPGNLISFASVADFASSSFNDVVNAASSNYTEFDLGKGDDTFIGSDADERVFSGSGADVINLGAGDDYVRVGGGQEEFYGGAGKDYISYYDSKNGITANLATDEISGSWAVNDIMVGFESISGSRTGGDSITGTSGSNTIRTYGGNDRVAAGKGADIVELGSGNDYVRVGGGAETFDGGSGRDYISYYKSSGGIRIDLRDDEVSRSWAVNDTISDFEGASGSRTGNDVMLGTNGANTFRSYGGNDKLYGRGGSDKLYGGGGQDFLDGGGGSGTDLLYGGAGADVFEFDRGEGVDVIKDFENNIDQINLDNFNFSTSEAYDFAQQVGSDVVFDFGSDGMLTIENTTIGRLQNDLDVV